MRSRNNIPKILAFIIAAVILATLAIPGEALGWSATIGNRTHADIDDAAYKILSADPAFKNVKFPTPETIKNNDWVNPIDSGSTGPDYMGKTNGGTHFYNPRRNQGGGPDMVQSQFSKLVDSLKSGNAGDAAKAASWAAHYAADMCTPYHTQGAPRKDIMAIYDDAMKKGLKTVELPSDITGPLGLFATINNATHPNNFKGEIEAFIAGTAKYADMEDWFDPWYWDGRFLSSMKGSTHITYEGTTFAIPGSLLFGLSPEVKKYSDWWTNPTPSFDNAAGNQAAKIRQFALNCAQVTKGVVDSMDGNVFLSADPFLVSSVEAAATVWRASFSALAPTVTFSVPDKNQPKKFKVTGQVMNNARKDETAYGAKYRLTVTNGTLKSGKQEGALEDNKTDNNIGGGYGRTLEWEVEASNLGYCTAKLEVIGSYKNTPDLQYAVTEVTAPGILPVSVTNTSARRSHSIVFCLDNSSSMSGQPIKDAMNAGVQAVTSAVGSEVEMALYFFGQSGCEAPVRLVDFTVDRDKIKADIRTASARGSTPLAAAITAAGQYIRSSAQGEAATIILLTDGLETCSGDPVAAARALNPNLKLKTSWFAKPVYAASNTPIKLQVVGFNIKSPADETKLKDIALAGNGNYYPAAGVQQLTQALNQAIKEGTGGGLQFQTWWFIAGGAVLLLIIIISLARRGKRAPAPAAAPASVVYVAPPPQMAPGAAVYAPPVASFCPNCGARFPAGAAFCTGCGKPLTAQGPAFCPRCGTPVTAGSAFCSKCGGSLTVNMPYAAVPAAPPAAVQPQPAPPQPQAKKVSGIWWLVAIFLLLPGGLIAWAVVKKDNPKKAGQLLMVSLFVSMLVFYGIVQNIVN